MDSAGESSSGMMEVQCMKLWDGCQNCSPIFFNLKWSLRSADIFKSDDLFKSDSYKITQQHENDINSQFLYAVPQRTFLK